MKMKKNKKDKKEKPLESGEQSQEVLKINGHKKTKQRIDEKQKKNVGSTAPDKKENEISGPKDKQLTVVDASIFDYFKKLTSDAEQQRIQAGLGLLEQLSQTKVAYKREKELDYTLKRLIRGCGASTNSSRAGFFISLVGFLQYFKEDDIPNEKIFETMEKELHVGSTLTNKEDADAVVGKLLVGGALLHSGRFENISNEDLQKIMCEIIKGTKHRTYHASLGFCFIIEVINKISEEQFVNAVWPLLQQELIKPWPKQTLQTVHCLIAVENKFPSIVNGKFLKLHFGGTELLNNESFQSLQKIFWVNTDANILTHPGFELFGSYIAKCKGLGMFWNKFVDPGLKVPTKLIEIETLKIATDVMNNLPANTSVKLTDFLGYNFMKMFVESLKNLKQTKDEMLNAFCTEFLDALYACYLKLEDDKQKVQVIKHLILAPGTFDIEKYTPTRIIHQLLNSLKEDGVKEMYNIYKDIFMGHMKKNPENAQETWLHFERINAGYTMQHLLGHKAIQHAYEWREKQLKFFLTSGIFYTNANGEICKKDEMCLFNKDFSEQCKSMFYTSLHSKLNDLTKERILLGKLISYCNEEMKKKSCEKYFKIKNFTAIKKPWQILNESIANTLMNATKKNKSKKEEIKLDDNKLDIVFHILLLNMGLQLFKEPEMAGPVINDLLKCMDQAHMSKKKHNKHKQNASNNAEDGEPEWIEVVVDLFLHLLSQNASALRNIVNALFPHLCDNFNLTAIHQILSMLDMKDGHNPLSAKDDESEEEEQEAEDEESESDTNDTDENDDDDDSDDGNGDEDEDNEEEDDEDEEITTNDKLRNAISQALMANGGALPSKVGDSDDDDEDGDDMGDIDINDMTEAEGHRLDEALAKAFKELKAKNSDGPNKKSKSYRLNKTTVMHFRIRALDLLEIYLQHKPSLLISIEIMIALFNMLEFCVDKELKTLQLKVERVLNKLTAQRGYTIDPSDELKPSNIGDYLRLIVEKKVPAAIYDLTNRLRNKCATFLIWYSSKLDNNQNDKRILSTCDEYFEEFIISRNPKVNITLISEIFKLQWPCVWDLAQNLVQRGINMETRSFRRIQIYEVLSVLYQNISVQKLDTERTIKMIKIIEKPIAIYIHHLTNVEDLKMSPKEFQTLLELLLNIHKANNRLEQKSMLSSEDICNSIQIIRPKIHLESSNIYQKFCGTFKLKVIRNTKLQTNGEEKLENNTMDEKSTERSNGELDVGAKRKANLKQSNKMKKQKKLQRFEAVSKGLNGGIGFVTHTNGRASNDDMELDITDET